MLLISQLYDRNILQVPCDFVVVVLSFLHSLLGQIIPLVSVVDHSLLQRSQVSTQLTQCSVHRETDSLTESHLQSGQLVSELSVKLWHQGRGQLGLLQVSLVPELLRHHPSNLINTNLYCQEQRGPMEDNYLRGLRGFLWPQSFNGCLKKAPFTPFIFYYLWSSG